MVRKKVKPKRRKIGKIQQDLIVAAWVEMLRTEADKQAQSQAK